MSMIFMIVSWSNKVHAESFLPVKGDPIASSDVSETDYALATLSEITNSMVKIWEKQLETNENNKKSKYDSLRPFIKNAILNALATSS